MKQLKFLILIFVMAIAFTSCEKDDNNPSSTTASGTPKGFSIKGFWEGAYGYGIANNTYYYAFNISDNGIIEEIDAYGDLKGTGTWKLQGKKFSAQYHSLINPSVIYVLEGEYNSDNHKIAGAWGYKSKPIPEGIFYLSK